ncbi:MAG: N-6 DNA methylase [Acidobacteriia bacterium]|nr:N-6 DNA methylase [Terriglobia bacterium]MYK08202.1 N-6 DNA methylase [Terriglobia bacterium]
MESNKQAGSYYTPQAVANTLVQWAVRRSSDLLLDPACGDGRFLVAHRACTGVERSATAVSQAKCRVPWAKLHHGDFFEWAASAAQRFDCAAGNPPFIRYQSFQGQTRTRALSLCRSLGASFSGLTSSWAPFLVAAAGRLKPGGRMAFVVPAEIGHAPYAVPLLDYLAEQFRNVHVVAVKKKLFPDLSEDCWLLFADGFGSRTEHLLFSWVERFDSSAVPPRDPLRIPIREWRKKWNRRLRPYLLPSATRTLYQHVAANSASRRLGEIASVGIGYVSGANDFFHLRPSEAEGWGIPESLLHPTVRSSRGLPNGNLTSQTLDRWMRADDPMMLLRIPKTAQLPVAVRDYLNSDMGQKAREAYKCRTRRPWYSVPDVRIPDYFLTYMSGISPSLVKNSARATCSNAVHAVQVNGGVSAERILAPWLTPFVRLSCELEGHPLGGGMLKLEPREAARIVLPGPTAISSESEAEIADAASIMRGWRHYKVS